MQVDEDIEIWSVVVLPLVLACKGAGDIVPLRTVPFGVPPGIHTCLHVHDSRLYRELQEPFQVEGKCRKRQDLLIGRILREQMVVQMQEASYDELLPEVCAEHADRLVGVLFHHSQSVVPCHSPDQGIACLKAGSPVRYVQASFNLCAADVAEIVVPAVQLIDGGVHMPLVETWPAGLCTYLAVQGYGRFAGFAERVELQFRPGAEVRVACVRTREYQMPFGVPPEIVPNETFDARIGIQGVFSKRGGVGRGDIVIAVHIITYSEVDFGYEGLFFPRLKPEIQLVVKFGLSERIGLCPVCKGPSVAGVFEAVPHETGCEGVSPRQEFDREAVLLVSVEGELFGGGQGFVHSYLHLP